MKFTEENNNWKKPLFIYCGIRAIHIIRAHPSTALHKMMDYKCDLRRRLLVKR